MISQCPFLHPGRQTLKTSQVYQLGFYKQIIMESKEKSLEGHEPRICAPISVKVHTVFLGNVSCMCVCVSEEFPNQKNEM